MSIQININAFYDSLSVAHKLDNFLDGFKREEIHLFCYFSAFLSHYKGNPAEDWDYGFIVSTMDGFPHSKSIDDAIERHINVGAFEIRGSFLSITSRGTDEYKNFIELSNLKKREEFIDAACNTSILIPYKETEYALLNDINIQKARSIQNDSWVDFQYENLKTISTSLGASLDDLTISAITWIRLLIIQIENKN
ncbi:MULTISPECIES: hypothetical protein [Flavobacterium]|uniref:hypothetical protein n=1 Tax=Flavobacterium TaxID=237 RepID=UPI002115066F|nr:MULTISPECIES: hypothetical protein [Flavobacterium]UUF13541.1 hypothetical protein NLJ00_20000 [Flavobacterium panici]